MATLKFLRGLKGIWQAVCDECSFKSQLGSGDYADKTANTHTANSGHITTIIKISDTEAKSELTH